MSNTVIFSFGRFQPPTIAHEMMFNFMKSLSVEKNADVVVYVSKTQDRDRNPLGVNSKTQLLRKISPNIEFIPCNNEIRTPIQAAKQLNSKYKNLVFVCGSDRFDTLGNAIKSQNSLEYQYDNIEIVSAGDRLDGEDGLQGISGTAARIAALNGDFETFRKIIPLSLNDYYTKILLEVISNNIREDLSNNDGRIVLTQELLFGI